MITVIKEMIIAVTKIIVVLLLLTASTNAQEVPDDNWKYIGEYYGDVYYWQYASRDEDAHKHIVWVKRTIPIREVHPANRNYRYEYTLMGVALRDDQSSYTNYEIIRVTEDGKEVFHKEWDTNWYPVRINWQHELVEQMWENGHY